MEFTPAGTPSLASFVAIVVVVLVAIVVGVGSAARRLGEPAALWTRRAVVLLALWVGATSAVVVSGALSGPPVPALPMFFASILAGAVIFGLSRFGRLLARGLPLGALVAFQGFRLPLELVLHAWAEQGTIPQTMTWTGQNWDVVAGVLAFVLAPFAGRSRRAAAVFGVLGFVLLLNVVRVAVMSSPLPFAWDVEPPLQLIRYLPYALIGPVLVAAALAGHIILFRALRSQPAR